MGGPHTRTLPTMPRTHVLFILVPTTRQLSSLCRAGNKIRKQNNQLILADSSERERKKTVCGFSHFLITERTLFGSTATQLPDPLMLVVVRLRFHLLPNSTHISVYV